MVYDPSFMIAMHAKQRVHDMRKVPKHLVGRVMSSAIRARRWMAVATVMAAHWDIVRTRLDRIAEWVKSVSDEDETGVRLVRVAQLCNDIGPAECMLGLAANEEFITKCSVSAALLVWLHGASTCLGLPISDDSPSCLIPGGSLYLVRFDDAERVEIRPPSAQALMLWRLLAKRRVVVAAMMLQEFPDIRWCMVPCHGSSGAHAIMRAVQRSWQLSAKMYGDANLEAFLFAHGIREDPDLPTIPPVRKLPVESPPRSEDLPEVPLPLVQVDECACHGPWWADRDPEWVGPVL